MTSPSAARALGEEFLEHYGVGCDDVTTVGVTEARRVVTALLEALREATEGTLTQEESDAIRKEIREGTPNTPQRIETMRRADEAYQRSFGAPSTPSAAAIEAAERALDEWAQLPTLERFATPHRNGMVARLLRSAYAVDALRVEAP